MIYQGKSNKSDRERELEAELKALQDARRAADLQELLEREAAAERARQEKEAQKEALLRPNRERLGAFCAELRALLAKYDDIHLSGSDGECEVYAVIGQGSTFVDENVG